MLPPARTTRRYVRDYSAWIGRKEFRDAAARGAAQPALAALKAKRAGLRRRAWLSLRRDSAWAKAFKGAAKLDGAIAELTAAAGAR
jgi:hypothetical protein